MSSTSPAVASTSPARVVAALGVGALCGAGLLGGWMLVAGAATGQARFGLLMAAFAFVIALPLWGAGLVVVGLPIWAMLHSRSVRSRRAAATVGAILVSVPSAIWDMALDGSMASSAIWVERIAFIAGMGLTGAIVGWVVARVAYGRSETSR